MRPWQQYRFQRQVRPTGIRCLRCDRRCLPGLLRVHYLVVHNVGVTGKREASGEC